MDSAVVAHQVMFDMAWISDPTAWLGLLTLVVIEIVLGIDNLVFIAILSAKLPPSQRNKARYIGLGGALVIRLILLTFISYIVSMTVPLFHISEFGVSGRDLVMLVGGIFLLYKATHELHAKLEGFDEELSATKAAGNAFGLVVIQIMVLDAVFSLDAIITAVGMIDHVFIMMFAVVIAMGVMTLASKAITEFVSHHPTVVILCLGFLLLIGFSLIVEALHFHVPKGYLYAAIGFSILIEVFNQVARKNTLKLGSGTAVSMQSREVAANLVLRLLGSNLNQVQTFKEAIVSKTDASVFNFQEKEMVSRVLQLSSLPVKTVMTARTDIDMVDITDKDSLFTDIGHCSFSRVVAYKDGERENPIGYIKKADLLSLDLKDKSIKLDSYIREPLYLPETVNVLKALEEFRKSKKSFAFIVDEFGNFEGIATLHDIMEEMAGELPDQAEVPELVKLSPAVFKIEGDAILKDVARLTGFIVPQSDIYHTIAGFILDYLQRLPVEGEKIVLPKWEIDILKVDGMTIESVKLINLTALHKENKK